MPCRTVDRIANVEWRHHGFVCLVDGLSAGFGGGIVGRIFGLMGDAAVVDETLRGGKVAAVTGAALESVKTESGTSSSAMVYESILDQGSVPLPVETHLLSRLGLNLHRALPLRSTVHAHSES